MSRQEPRAQRYSAVAFVADVGANARRKGIPGILGYLGVDTRRPDLVDHPILDTTSRNSPSVTGFGSSPSGCLLRLKTRTK